MERYFEKRNAKNLVIFDHHFVRKSQIYGLNKLTSKELCLNLADANTAKQAAQDYFQNLFYHLSLTGKKYFLIRKLLWIQRRVCSSKKFYIIFYMETKCFLNKEK